MILYVYDRVDSIFGTFRAYFDQSIFLHGDSGWVLHLVERHHVVYHLLVDVGPSVALHHLSQQVDGLAGLIAETKHRVN